MKRIASIFLAAMLFATASFAQQSAQASVHSHTSAATITVPAPPDSLQFVYIIGIDITNCAGASAVTAAAPTFITTTNLSGAPQYALGSGVTAGQCTATPSVAFTNTLRATTAGAAVTFILPTFATNQTVSVNVYYSYDRAN